MAYSDKVIDHYENPRNVGSFEKGDESVGTGMVGAPACGDVMKLQIKVGADGRIEDARFKTYGCGSAIASSSLVTEWVKGKTLDEAAKAWVCAWACAPRAARAWPTSSSSSTRLTRMTCSSKATASRSWSIRRACPTSTAPSSTTRARASTKGSSSATRRSRMSAGAA